MGKIQTQHQTEIGQVPLRRRIEKTIWQHKASYARKQEAKVLPELLEKNGIKPQKVTTRSKSTIQKHMNIKNIVIISFDSLRCDYVEALHSDEAPAICYMRNKGAFFNNTIVQAPLTIPSHLCMLTGLYPARTGVRDMHHRLSCEVPNIFTILKKQGFRTIFSSNVGIFRNLGIEGIDQHIPLRIRNLKKAIAGLHGRCFFAFLHYWDIHTPYTTRLPILKPIDLLLNLLKPLDKYKHIRYLRRVLGALWLMRVKRIRTMMKTKPLIVLPALKKGYKKAIISADRFLADVLKTLKATNTLDDILLIVTSDHGDSFNEHNEIQRAQDGRYEHGQFLYDNTTKVPLIICWPKRSFGRKLDYQVQQVDIVPTILEALRITHNGDFDGKSLWGACIGKDTKPETKIAVSEIVRDSLDKELRSVRTTNFKLIRDYKNNKFEFYNLKADPEEKNNLWPAEGYEQKAILEKELEKFSEISSNQVVIQSGHEQQQIKKALCNLGYMD